MLKGVLYLIKLVALDLDGTLLTGEKKITEENKKAIKLAKEQGVKVVLCTGRPIVSIVHLLEELDLMGDDDYAINFNGGLIQKTKHGEIIYETGHTVEDMKYCHEEVTKVGLPLVMIDTVRAYEPTPPKGRPSIYNTLPHPITFEQKISKRIISLIKPFFVSIKTSWMKELQNYQKNSSNVLTV